MLPGLETLNCQNLAVPMEVMQHVVRVESSYNPFAIGVVGGHLVYQPKSLPQALATVKMLETKGYNFSLGLAQVNRYNLSKYGLDSYQKAFDACPNLKAGSEILAECYHRLNGDWGKSFSCYYSGNSVTGFRHGYVQKIYSSMRKSYPPAQEQIPATAIPVVGQPSRRMVGVKRYPVYSQTLTDSAPLLAATPRRAVTASQQRIVQANNQPLSKMQRIIASYNQPNATTSATASMSQSAEQPQRVPIQQTVQAANTLQALPVQEQPVLLQPTNPVPNTAVGAEKSAFVF
jgi:type IV secretion system protein VirB1